MTTDAPRRQVSGRGIPLPGNDIDTDRIIPARFLKEVTFESMGEHVFEDAKKQHPDHPFNQSVYQGAAVLVVGQNFGCGSSREHAPWALEDAGFRAVIAPSFADIFRSNCLKIGLLPVQLPDGSVRQLMEVAAGEPATMVTVDLEELIVSAPGFSERFQVDPFARECLLNGWDTVALTLRHEAAIAAYEARRDPWMPRVLKT